MIKIAPSLLSADFLDLNGDLEKVAAGGADYLHFDVMDGRFVPNISFGLPILEAVAKRSLPVDVHLMIVEPEKYIDQFAAKGAHIITVHAEATAHLHRAIQQIHAAGCLAGAALNPGTSPESISYVLGDLDLVLVMTVNPGFGAQKLVPACVKKIAEVRRMLEDSGSDAVIEVDGGVNTGTAEMLVQSGADILVAGSAVFSAPDPAAAVRDLRAAVSKSK
ncbi:MAG: ribulose-phosphate 3-epimerase [Clostridia bacterium]|nr:ribulose-phosphate 3-epimerase [Clostridia bacterium]